MEMSHYWALLLLVLSGNFPRIDNSLQEAFNTSETAFNTSETAFNTSETAFNTSETAFNTSVKAFNTSVKAFNTSVEANDSTSGELISNEESYLDYYSTYDYWFQYWLDLYYYYEQVDTSVTSTNTSRFSFTKNCHDPHDALTNFMKYDAKRLEVNSEQLVDEVSELGCGSEAGLVIQDDGGTIHFRAPCCALRCSFRRDIFTYYDEVMKLEFLEMDIPSPYIVNSDGSLSCKDSRLRFQMEDLEFCGNRLPEPFEVTFGYSHIFVETNTNVMCQDYLSFSLKYELCELQDTCEVQHTVVERGVSGLITSPGYREGKKFSDDNNCYWTIQVSNSSLLQLSFESFHFLNAWHYIKVTSVQENKAESREDIELLFRVDDYRVSQGGYHLTLPSHVALVEFSTFLGGHASGFKMNYKAVSDDEYVPVLGVFRLNCTGHENSVPPHTLCDFQTDCLHGEDESNCSYVDEARCPGGHVFESSCYQLLPPRSPPITWYMAEEICDQRFNGNLMTINSQEELNFISDLIHPSRNPWYFGIRQKGSDSNFLYRKLYQGLDGATIFGGFFHQFSSETAACTVWDFQETLNQREMANVLCRDVWIKTTLDDIAFNFEPNVEEPEVHIACEVKTTSTVKRTITLSSGDSVWTEKILTFQCVNSRERIFVSRRCDNVPDCFDGSDETYCDSPSQTSTHFTCSLGNPLWFTHVCDGVDDCLDQSDEEFCLPVPDDEPSLAVCTDGTAVSSGVWCDAKPDCLDGSDEWDCWKCNGGAILCPFVGCLPGHWVHDDSLDCPIREPSGQWLIEPEFVPHTVLVEPPPGVVMPDGYGKVNIQPLDDEELCPSTHVQCPRGYCIPSYMLCNGYKDCPEGEDELPETCQSLCQGRYKCHNSLICLHDDHVCDGWFNCPLHDDEMFCFGVNTTCPPGCVCLGQEVTYHGVSSFPDTGCIKRLDISNSLLQNDSLSIHNHCYIALEARNTKLRQLGVLSMINLFKLDLSNNQLRHLDLRVFEGVLNIRELLLAQNDLTEADLQPIGSLTKLEVLHVSGNSHNYLRSFSFSKCSRLRELHLEDMGITVVEDKAFSGLVELQELHMSGNPVSTFEPAILSELSQLSMLNTDNYKLCCSAIVPDSLSKGGCEAPVDEFSSCDEILSSTFYKVFLWLIAVLTVVGNSGVLVYKFCIERKRSRLGYSTFITSLSSADLLMGVYLAIIGAADQAFKGRYLWESDVWKSSSYCSLAGFLCVASSEVSAVTIFMVTLDRYLALTFPLAKHFHVTPSRARVLVLVTWSLGLLLAAIPLLPPLSHWQFYSQNGVCTPLPITRANFPGSDYAFFIFIVFNFVIFVSIAVGQVLILRSVRASNRNLKSVVSNRSQQDSAIARKLALVVLTDFLCWFPIGIMGLLAKLGVPVPGEVNVIATIFILPLNSALNPYLYTVPAAVGKLRDREKNKKVQQANRVGKKVGNNRRQDVHRRGEKIPAKSFQHGGRADNPDVCLRKLRDWLKKGRISSVVVRQILGKF